jgi:hypothetical protein
MKLNQRIQKYRYIKKLLQIFGIKLSHLLNIGYFCSVQKNDGQLKRHGVITKLPFLGVKQFSGSELKDR